MGATFAAFHGDGKPPEIGAGNPETEEHESIGKKHPELDRFMKERAIVQLLDPVTATVVGSEDLAGPGIELKFPVTRSCQLDQAAIWTDIKTSDVLPCFDLCLALPLGDLEHLPERKRGFSLFASHCLGLDPGDLLFHLKQQPGNDHQQQGDCGCDCAPAVQFAEPAIQRKSPRNEGPERACERGKAMMIAC